MDNYTMAKLGSFCTWIRLVLVVVTFLFNIALVKKLASSLSRRCSGCALLLNVCVFNCVNLTGWLVINAMETNVWTSDLAPRLCKIQRLCIDFWEIFILVNILALCILNCSKSQSKKTLYRLLSLTWIVSGVLYAVPMVTSFADVVKERLGYFDFADIVNDDVVSRFGLMICEQDLSAEKNLIVVRYLSSALPLALLIVIFASRAMTIIKQRYPTISCRDIVADCGHAGRLHHLEPEKGKFTKELSTDLLPNNSESETTICSGDCPYNMISPVLGLLLLFHFVWQALLKPLCILSLAFSGKRAFFDVGSVLLTIVFFYLPMYTLISGWTNDEETPATEKTMKAPETIDVKTVMVIEAIEV